MRQTKVIYIAGWGRSGSTILGMLLDQVEGAFFGGEIRYVGTRGIEEQRLCSCGESFGNCEFWKCVVEQSDFDQHDKNRIKSRKYKKPYGVLGYKLSSMIGLSNINYLKEYTHTIQKLYSSIRKCSEADIIVDSSKFPLYGYLLRFAHDIDLRVIHLVRNPNAVAYSWRRKKKKIDNTVRKYMPRYSIGRSSLQWLVMNLLTEFLFEDMGDNYYFLKYEDLVNHPKKIMISLEKFLLDDSSNIENSIGENEFFYSTNHSFSGNPGRFRSGKIQLFEDNEWEVKMPLIKKWIVRLITFPLLKKYGYLKEALDGQGDE